MDTDNNGLIDALECIATVCVVSGMDTIDKLFFAFSLYDFERCGSLTHNGVTLLLRSIFSGFGKICSSTCDFPTELEISKYADLLFADASKSNDDKLTSQEFQHYSCMHPVVGSWIRYMSSITWQPANDTSGLNLVDSDSEEVNDTTTAVRSVTQKKRRIIHAPISDDVAVDHPWFEFVDAKMTPNADEMPPGVLRTDVVEDTFDPVWIHGYCNASSRNNVRYGACTNATGTNNIIMPVSNSLISMYKNPETQVWEQSRLTKHTNPIVCCEMDISRRLCATADAVNPDIVTDGAVIVNTSTVIIWDMKTGATVGTIVLPHLISVRCLDFSADSAYLLIAGGDADGSIYVYDLSTFKVVFATTMSTWSTNKSSNGISNARFFGSSTMFCVANGSDAGVLDFFIEEDGNYMGTGKCKVYNHYVGLYQAMGSKGVSVPITCISKFEFPDECIVGNTAGHVMYWRGKNCLQLLEAHEKAVTAISFENKCKLLVTGSKDQKIRLYNVVGATADKLQRSIEVVGIIDVLGSSKTAISSSIRSLCLSEKGEKVLVSVKSGEIMELSCKEGAVAATTEEDAPEGESAGVKLGDDINGGPIFNGHWHKLLSNDTELQAAAAGSSTTTVRITGVAKVPGGFVSCASDGVVRKWQEDLEPGAPHKCVKHIGLDSGCVALATSSTVLAVSFDGTLNDARKNSVQLISLDGLTPAASLTVNHTGTVNAMGFSSDGSVLATASLDNTISIYTGDGGASWSVKGKLEGHTSKIVGVDISTDNMYARSLDTAEALIVWDISGSFGEEVKSRDVLKTIQWATHSCPANWDMKNAWSGLHTGEFFNCCDRFNGVFVSGLASGEISLTRVPCTEFVQLPNDLHFRKIHAHYGGVSALCFLDEGAKLVTAGSVDGCIQVWNVAFDTEEVEPDELPLEEGEEALDEAVDDEDEEDPDKPKFIYADSADEEDDVDGVECVKFISRRKKGHKEGVKGPAIPCVASDEKETRIEALSAVTSWLETDVGYSVDELLLNSANTTRDVSFTPNDELSLEWIHGGYSCRATRASVRYSKNGKIVYPVGATAVVHDKVTGKQSYFCEHDSNIGALDVHRASGMTATVQCANGAVILCIWDADTTKCVRRIDCGNVFGASAVAFSPCGVYVAVACLDYAHTVMIFDWKNEILHAKYNGGAKKILCMCFGLTYDPLPPPTAAANPEVMPPVVPPATVRNSTLRLLQCGIKHFNVVDIKQQSVVNVKTGKFGEGVKKSNILCCAALPLTADGGNEFVVGLSNGTIGTISKDERRIGTFNSVLERGSITSVWVCVTKEATTEEPPEYSIVCGCTQGHVKVLDMEFAPTSEFNIYASEEYGLFPIGQVYGIKSLCADKTNRKLLVGTAGGEILEIQIENGDDVNDGPIVQSHFCGNLLALDTHPTRQEAITVGDDKTLCIWDLDKSTQINKIELPDIGRCCNCAPNGLVIAVGLGADDLKEGRVMPRENDGKVVVVSYMQNVLRIVHETIDCKGPVSSVLYSPDSSVLYAGSRAMTVCIYDALSNYALLTVIESGIEQPIRNMDISLNGAVLAVNGTDDELVLFDTQSRVPYTKPENNEILSTTEWHRRNITVGLDTVGIFPQYGSSPDVACLTRSHDKKLLVTGDVWGNLNMFRNPCPLPNAPCKTYKAHSTMGGTSKVAFSAEDAYLVSIGKCDRSIMQWKLKPSEVPGDAMPSTGLVPHRKARKPREPPKEEAVAASNDGESAPDAESGDVQTGPGNTANNFDPDKFTINGVCFAKSEEKTSVQEPLELTNVYGLNQLRCNKRPTAFYIGSGDILSFAGNVPMVTDKSKSTKKIWNLQNKKHQSCDIHDIGVVTPSADGRCVFVGERDARGIEYDMYSRSAMFIGKIRVLDASNGREVSVIDSCIYGGVNGLATSPCGTYLACIGNDDGNSLYVYHSISGNWCHDVVRVFSSKMSMRRMDLACFIYQTNTGSKAQRSNILVNGFSTASSKEQFQLVTAGAGSLRFWRMHDNGAHSVSELGEYGPMYGAKDIVTTGVISVIPGQVISSDASGNLYFWTGHTCTSRIALAHESGITCLVRQSTNPNCSGNAANYLTSCNTVIKQWLGEIPIREFKTMDIINRLNMPLFQDNFPSPNGALVTSICVDSSMSRMLLCFNSTSTVAVEVTVDSSDAIMLTEGNVGCSHLIASNPSCTTQFVTATNTGLLKLWDSTDVTGALQRHMLDENITAIAFRNDGKLLAVCTYRNPNPPNLDIDDPNVSEGDNHTSGVNTSSNILFLTLIDGKFNVVNKLTNAGSGYLTSIRFSPDNSVLIAASSSSSFYVYNQNEGGTKISTPTYRYVGRMYAPSVQNGFDFSNDNRFLRSFSEVEHDVCTGEVLAPTDIHFYDLQATVQEDESCGRELVNPEMLEMMMNSTAWTTTSSAYTTETKGLVDAAARDGLVLTSIDVSKDLRHVVTGYHTGVVKLHK